MNAQIDHDQVEEDQREPDGVGVLLHGVAERFAGLRAQRGDHYD